MVTFETEEEFEKAVMSVIAKKLKIEIDKERDHGFISSITVAIVDVDNGCISEAYA